MNLKENLKVIPVKILNLLVLRMSSLKLKTHRWPQFCNPCIKVINLTKITNLADAFFYNKKF